MLGRQEEIKPLGQPGQYMPFPFTFLLLPFINDNKLSYSHYEQNVTQFLIIEGL